MAKSEKRNKGNDASSGDADRAPAEITTEKIRSWLEVLPTQELSNWDRLPDIGLYMDQVLTLMDRQLAVYKRDANEKLLTQPMINNYTKDGLLPRATDKKYTQGHLALLSVLCSLKPVLSITDLSVMLDHVRLSRDEKAVYTDFLVQQKQAIEETTASLLQEITAIDASLAGQEDADAERKSRLAGIALHMAIDARARIMITQKIIDSISK